MSSQGRRSKEYTSSFVAMTPMLKEVKKMLACSAKKMNLVQFTIEETFGSVSLIYFSFPSKLQPL
jgi:hypothetical protein